MDLKGKTAFVTGGASGIGAGLCEELASRGCHVIVADIDGDGAARIAGGIGALASPVECDVSDLNAVEEIAGQLWEHHHGIDLVFANAGVGAGNALLKATEAEFDFIYGINVKGMWATCKAFGRRMAAEGRDGYICITASEHALGKQHLGAGLYTGSKHAALGIADILRHETPDNIRVSAFCPGLVNTGIHNSKRHSTLPQDKPEHVAFGEAIMAKGMDPRETARHALDNVLKGEFFIFTHACARYAADERYRELSEAFEQQAPHTETSDRYLVENVRAEVMKEFSR